MNQITWLDLAQRQRSPAKNKCGHLIKNMHQCSHITKLVTVSGICLQLSPKFDTISLKHVLISLVSGCKAHANPKIYLIHGDHQITNEEIIHIQAPKHSAHSYQSKRKTYYAKLTFFQQSCCFICADLNDDCKTIFSYYIMNMPKAFYIMKWIGDAQKDKTANNKKRKRNNTTGLKRLRNIGRK